ncbi:MAG: hypothetical protein Rhirs2KO_11370 [Rhizobiaceae bacterium]
MLIFCFVLALIGVMMSLPLVTMYATGGIVGQRTAPRWLAACASLLVGLGLAYGVWRMTLSFESPEWTDWLLIAWTAGAAVAAQLTLLTVLSKSGALFEGDN